MSISERRRWLAEQESRPPHLVNRHVHRATAIFQEKIDRLDRRWKIATIAVGAGSVAFGVLQQVVGIL
jgi:hypothetical protein